MRQRFLRGEPHLAFAMAVEMIFAFVGKELDRADVAVTGLQCMLDGEVVAFAVEGGRLPSELAGRMRVGIGGEAKAVEERDPPIHGRVGREAGLDRENAIGEVAVALGNRVESGLRSQRREPRRPDVGRYQIGVRTGFECDFEQVAGIQAENRAAIGRDVADAGEPCRHAIDGLKIGCVDQVMDFAGAVGLLVDGGDFDLEHEACRGAAHRR